MTGRRSRRGAEAIEFALVLPVFLLMVFGTFEYGLLFFTQFQVSTALHSALRVGSLQAPDEDERSDGGCDTCVALALTESLDAFDRLGIDIDPADLSTALEERDGVCALVLTANVPHEPILGLFAVPDSYTVQSALPAHQVTRCDG